MKRIVHENGTISYTFDSIGAHPVRAHVSTRHGGVSPEPWRSLNFSTSRGDTLERVQANRARFADAIGIDVDAIVRCRQVHGTAVAKVDWSDAGSLQDGVDALITDAPGLPLALVFADCVPVLLYDPVHQALGVCHAGWRGTVNGAAVATLWAMEAAYSTEPSDVVACIGPSIGPASYEVGDEVVRMVEAKLPNPDTLFSYPNGRENRAYFDLWKANASQLVDAGIPAAQIEISGIDTATNTNDFFSHRAEQGRCGLFTMIAWLTAG
jgi:YfiH family protein